MKRSDIVIVDYPYSDRAGSKIRPALIVQGDAWNQVRADTILAVISTVSNRRPATELYLDATAEPGSGLRLNSYVQCDTLVTLDQSLVLLVIGTLSAATMQKVDACLRSALGL